MKILISGAGGLLGKRLCAYFRSQSAEVLPIVRVRSDQSSKIGAAWNPQSGWFDLNRMEEADIGIHLAGDNIAKGRWTLAKKNRIRASRVDGTTQLANALSHLQLPPRRFFCASAVGFYGNSESQPRTETDAAGKGFLASVCVDWENATFPATAAGISTTLLRFGVILDSAGGALGKMLIPFRLGLGGRLGSGKQFFPWIAAPEIPQIIEFLAQQPASSLAPVNVVAPQIVTNGEFTHALAQHLLRPSWLPVPEFAIRSVFGEMGREMLLSGCPVLPQALVKKGYVFRYPTLDACFKAILPR